MLHILFLILKVIGILLLVILGVILLLLITVLFVPVRYKGQGSYFEKPTGSLRVSWLLFIFSVTVSYKEQLDIVVRLFGVQILKPRAETGAGDRPETEEGRESFPSFGDVDGDFTDEPMVSVQEIKGPSKEAKLLKPMSPEPDMPDASKQLTDEDPLYKKSKKKNIFLRAAEKIKRFFRHLMLSFKHLCNKLKQASDVKNMALDFIKDEKNKKTFHLIIKQGKKVIKHLFPRKIKGYITFGFDDPYTTGQVLTGAAFLYPLYHKQFSLQPVFDRQVIEGELTFKGRIRMAAILSAGLRILIDKNFRIQLKRFMNRGGM